jgi:hypothetical protein
MRRALVAIALWACAGATAHAASDEEMPRVVLPEPPPVEPLTRHMTLALVIRLGGLGFDLSFNPIERLEIGVEVSSSLFVSEAGLYARYAVVHQGSNDVLLGVRWHGIATLTFDEDTSPSHALLSPEIGYEHRFGANLVGVDLAVAVRRDAEWFPNPATWPVVTGGVRLGHFW